MGERNSSKLSPNMGDLLERLARGEKVAEIAAAWEVHEQAVYQTLTRVKAKLGARTDCEAVALWIRGNR